MKTSHRWAMLAAAVAALSYLILPALAQQGPVRSGPGPSIALVDISYIFKHHGRFKGQMDDMKADVQRAEAQVKSERQAITKLAEHMQELRKGTQDYKQLEEELAKRQADLSVQVTLQKNKFLQREAEIYYNVYQEIAQATEYYAKQHGIDVVLRFNGDPADVQRPDSILSFINKPVVYYQPGLDITPAVLSELNRTAIDPGAASRTTPFGPGVQFGPR